MDLSIAGISAQKQVVTQNEIAVSVMKKSLDIQAQEGADLVKMMDQASGLGGRVDQYA